MTLLDDRLVDPPHQGRLNDATGVGAVGNPACGDVVTLYIRAPHGTIEASSFETMGSVYQMATASVLCDCIQDQPIDDARVRDAKCITQRLPDLPENKQHLARLAIDALQRAVADHERRLGGGDQAVIPRASVADAEAFVLRMLGNGRQWGTLEMDAMAKADGLRWPVPLARFLSDLRERGVIEGEMAGTSWRWWGVGPADGGR